MKKTTVMAILLALFSSCGKTPGNNGAGGSTNTTPAGITFTDLYNFQSTYGANAVGALIHSGNTLYGMTPEGGINGKGNIFSINIDGTGLTDLHDFAGGSADGETPDADLTLSGGLLYGMTAQGGVHDEGTIFSINPDGTGFKLLYTFNTDVAGSSPTGNLFIDNNIMYGMTSKGGDSGLGNIFYINTDGTGYTDAFDFTHATGFYPGGSLLVSGSTFYGVTASGGGPANDGVIFSFNTTGNIFTKLFTFTGKDGAKPHGSLTLAGDNVTLYGTTISGGANNSGNIFSITKTGTGFDDEYDFNENGSGGVGPECTLVINGNTLYGTLPGGADLGGYVFSISLQGTGFKNIYSFSSGANGSSPHGSLLLFNNVLYGMTYGGGKGNGVIYGLTL